MLNTSSYEMVSQLGNYRGLDENLSRDVTPSLLTTHSIAAGNGVNFLGIW